LSKHIYYAKQKKSQHWEDTTDSELTAFLGMLIAMGMDYRGFECFGELTLCSASNQWRT